MYPTWLIDCLGMTKTDFRQNHNWGSWLFPAVREGRLVQFVPLNCTVTNLLEQVANATGIDNAYIQPICDLERAISELDCGLIYDQAMNAQIVRVAGMVYRLLKKSALVWGRRRQLKNVADDVGHFVKRASECENKLVTTAEFSSILFRNNGYFKGYSTLTWVIGHLQYLLEDRVELHRMKGCLRDYLETVLLRRGQFLPIPVHAPDHIYLVIVPLAGTDRYKYPTLNVGARASLKRHFGMFLRIDDESEVLEQALQRNWQIGDRIGDLQARVREDGN
jgi:hypothetical protein